LGEGRKSLRRTVTVLLFMFLLLGTSISTFFTQPVKAGGTIYVRSDGSIDPLTAPIFTADNITYVLTANIIADSIDGIVIQRNNTILDGAAFTIKGTGLINSKGINLNKTSNITIQNISVRFFFNGISLTTSKNNHIIDACLFNNSYGIYLQSSNYNVISGNNITDNSWGGIWLYNSQNNNITKNRLANSIANNFGGIKLQDFSDKNNIVENYIAANRRYGIYIENCWSNHIYHNNFTDNVYHAYVDPQTSQTNKWDNGYPSGGNYWNDRSKVDFFSGPFQNESGSDGIGDISYVIDSNNKDSYPLMEPWVPYENETIYVLADGSVDPTGAPLWRKGDVYALTDNIGANENGIVIERDNMTLDGAGYTLEGTLMSYSTGVYLLQRNNITIENMEISRFINGIFLNNSGNIRICGNKVTDNSYCIYLFSSNDNSVATNSITTSMACGITLAGFSSHNGISRNNVSCTSGEGIDLSSSSGNSVFENNIQDSYNGIDLEFSDNNTLSKNNVTGNHGIGILLWSSSGNVLRGNNIARNTYSFGVHGDFVNDVDVSNTVDGKPIYYWVGEHDQTVPLDAGYIGLVKCSNITVQNVNVSNNEQGILLVNTTDSAISQNNIANNDYGIDLQLSCSNNSISGNDLTNNRNGIVLSSSGNNSISGNSISVSLTAGICLSSSNNNSIVCNNMTHNGFGIALCDSSSNNIVSRNNISSDNLDGITLTFSSSHNSILGNSIDANNGYGVSLWGSCDNNRISGNNITSNSYGIGLGSSSSNSFIHNSFMSNTQQVQSDNSTNTWDDGYPSGGNYWSDYAGNDTYSGLYQNETGSDGIGDTSYIADLNSKDHYPLMKTWSPPDAAVFLLATLKTIIGQGFTEIVSVTFENQGNKIEVFNITVYANSNIIHSDQIMLETASRTLNFVWNTTGFAYGNYTMSAYAAPLPEEEDVADNNCTSNIPVHVGVPGDVSGVVLGDPDGKCDMRDINYVLTLFNTYPSSSNWKPNSDINNDGTVNFRDIQIAILNFGKHE